MFTSWLTYKAKIKETMLNSETIVDYQISLHSAGTKLQIDHTGEQFFYNKVHNGFVIQILNNKPFTITWGDLRNVLRAVAKFCFVQLCNFEFSTVGGSRIGVGRLYKG